ncbi:MAG TPA: hypothetical protein VHC68_02020 [Candidatus Paceibacterota bacterium]|nr:hypothetical protein [Candidatus Paceibacterota bacterium]
MSRSSRWHPAAELPPEELLSSEVLRPFLRRAELRLLLGSYAAWLERNGEAGELLWHPLSLRQLEGAAKLSSERSPRLYTAVSHEDPRHPYTSPMRPTGARTASIFALFAYVFTMEGLALPIAAHFPTRIGGLNLCGIWAEVMPGAFGFYLFEADHPCGLLRLGLRSAYALVSEAPRRPRREHCREVI